MLNSMFLLFILFFKKDDIKKQHFLCLAHQFYKQLKNCNIE